MRTSLLWEQFGTQREKLQINLTKKLKENMANLIGHAETADMILVAADGRRLPAHICILRQRAPVFFQRYIAPTLEAITMGNHTKTPIEVAVGDVDSAGLKFFIRSVYTEDEISLLTGEIVTEKHERPNSGDNNPLDEHKPDNSEMDQDFLDRTPSRNIEPNFKKSPTKSDNDSLTTSRAVSTSQLCDVTNQEVSVSESVESMSVSFTAADDYSQRQRQRGAEPIMTSFRELAASRDSNMCISGYSDVVDDSMAKENREKERGMSCKFIRLDTTANCMDESRSQSAMQRSLPNKAIFPLFIGFDGDETVTSEMSQSLPGPDENYQPPGSIRGRAMIARRLSVTSLTSLTSIDLTPTHEGPSPIADSNPSCKLAADLLEMYKSGIDADVVIVTAEGELRAHKCILYANSTFFRKQLKNSSRIVLKGFSNVVINFLLEFLYGGLTCIPDDVDVWEVIALATHLNIEELAQVAILHIKTHKCHFFHRPCATCVSAIFDALPQFHAIKCLHMLFEEAMSWQARNFSRIWKGRIFLHLNERWQKECFEALIGDLNEESFIDTLLGCEKLQLSLPRIKAQHLAETVEKLVADVVEFCTDFLISSFDLVIGSKSFRSHGKGLALNLNLIEDVFPTLVHSLSAECGIKTFIALKNLLLDIQEESELTPRRSHLSIPLDEWSPRFYNLCRRLCDLVDKHLLHYAASVVKSEAWELLSDDEQNHVLEAGIFVEMRLPKAPPPRLSSLNRSYKRSSSAGVQLPFGGTSDRARSLERLRPTTNYVVGKMETLKEMAREMSQPKIIRNKNTPEESTSGSPQIVPETEQPSNRQSGIPVLRQSQQNLIASSTSETAESSVRKRSESESPLRKPSIKKKGPPPVRRKELPQKPIENPEDFVLERQNTHTIMTVQQNKEAGLLDPTQIDVPSISSPIPSPNTKDKPKSVVRPMPKNPPLAAMALAPPSLSQNTASIGGGSEAKPIATLRSRLQKKQEGHTATSIAQQKPTTRNAVLKKPSGNAQTSLPISNLPQPSLDKTKRRPKEFPDENLRSKIPRSPKAPRKIKP